MHTQFLFKNTVTQINNIKTFIETVDQGIKVLPTSADSE